MSNERRILDRTVPIVSATTAEDLVLFWDKETDTLKASRAKGVGRQGLFDYQAQKRTICIHGDSWVVNEEYTGDDISTSAKGPFTWGNAFLGAPFQVISYSGIGGDRLDEMEARFEQDVLIREPGFVFVYGGINDIGQARTGAQMWASMKAMIDAAVAEGIVPIVAGCQPTGAISTAARLAAYRDYEIALRNYYALSGSFIYVPNFYHHVIDQSGATYPALLTSMREDESHIDINGAIGCGRAFADSVRPFLTNANQLPAHNYALMGIANTLFRGTGGSAGTNTTGTVADDWTVNVNTSGSGVASLVARTDYPGNWQQVVTTTAGADIEWRSDANFEVLSDQGLAPGDQVIGLSEIQLDSGGLSAGNLSAIQTSWVISTSGGATNQAPIALRAEGAFPDINATAQALLDGQTLVLSTLTVTLGASDYKVRMLTEVVAGDTAVSGTFRHGRVGLLKVA